MNKVEQRLPLGYNKIDNLLTIGGSELLILLQMFSGSQDESRLTDLIMRYWNEMVRYAESILGNHQDAEDAVQSAFISIFEGFDRYRDRDDKALETVLYVIVKNKSIDMYRKNSLRTYSSLDDNIRTVEFSVPEEDSLACAIAGLPERERDLILLRFYHGYSVGEIAEILDISYFAAQKGILRAKNKLIRKMEEGG